MNETIDNVYMDDDTVDDVEATPNKQFIGKVVGCDIDKTLCDGTLWNSADDHPRVNLDVVNLITELDKEGVFIFLYTARGPWLAEATYKWALSQGLNYPIAMRCKPPASAYLDDKSLNLNDFTASVDKVKKMLGAVHEVMDNEFSENT